MSEPTPDDILGYDEQTPGGDRGLGLRSLLEPLAWLAGFALLLSVVLSVVVEPFRIPSGSMVPTLQIGDHIAVSKFAYGLRLPFTSIELLPLGEPARGDIVVFRYPPDPTLDYIKRLVGLPGDVIELRANTVLVNGEEAARAAVGEYTFVNDRCHAEVMQEYSEDLLGVAHALLQATDRTTMPDYGPVAVPEGHYFMMGDNRDNSADSRFWGFVPREYIKGKATLVWLSYDFCAGGAAPGVRSERLFLRLR